MVLLLVAAFVAVGGIGFAIATSPAVRRRRPPITRAAATAAVSPARR